MSEQDLFRIAARLQFPGAVITGSGSFGLVRRNYGKPDDVFLYKTVTEQQQAQVSVGGQRIRVHAASASYRPAIRCGYGKDDD